MYIQCHSHFVTSYALKCQRNSTNKLQIDVNKCF